MKQYPFANILKDQQYAKRDLALDIVANALLIMAAMTLITLIVW